MYNSMRKWYTYFVICMTILGVFIGSGVRLGAEFIEGVEDIPEEFFVRSLGVEAIGGVIGLQLGLVAAVTLIFLAYACNKVLPQQENKPEETKAFLVHEIIPSPPSRALVAKFYSYFFLSLLLWGGLTALGAFLGNEVAHGTKKTGRISFDNLAALSRVFIGGMYGFGMGAIAMIGTVLYAEREALTHFVTHEKIVKLRKLLPGLPSKQHAKQWYFYSITLIVLLGGPTTLGMFLANEKANYMMAGKEISKHDLRAFWYVAVGGSIGFGVGLMIVAILLFLYAYNHTSRPQLESKELEDKKSTELKEIKRGQHMIELSEQYASGRTAPSFQYVSRATLETKKYGKAASSESKKEDKERKDWRVMELAESNSPGEPDPTSSSGVVFHGC